ncbi:MAG: autotransporter domain-containing protein [Burkholderiales bacterium]|nr:autotransporter domain-containing protein [Burkholderiales bacterium]
MPSPPDATVITGVGTTVEINNFTGGYVNVLSSIYNDSILNINNSNAIGLGDISGSGRLTKSSGGFLFVNGDWTYSGTTTVVGGGLSTSLGSINSTGRLIMVGGTFTNNSNNHFGSLEGTGGTIDINFGSLTVGGDNSSTTFAGSLTGLSMDGLTKTGTGTLILTQLPGYFGTTTISGGALQIGNGAALSGGMGSHIANNATLIIDTSGNISLNSLGGTGSLIKNGTGELGALGGAWTHAGNSTINDGLVSAAINSAGRLILNGGQLDTTGSTFGSIQGSGGNVNINGAGSLTVGGDNSSTTFAGGIGGDGTLVKNGSGTLTLSGTSASTGAIAVNSGMVVVNGSTTAAVTVNGGGMLGGSGSVGGLTAATGAVIAPGNSIGTLTVNGALTFNAGSTYRVEADAAGAADRINVTGAPGTATLNGGTVDVQAGAGTYNPTTTYTILNATGGVTGTFDTVTSNLAFLTPSLTYDPDNVFLTLTRNAATFQSVAATPNQSAVSSMLEAASAAAPGGDMDAVLTAVTALSAEQARAAFDAIAGATIVGLQRVTGSYTRRFGNMLDARIRQPAATRVVVAGPAMLPSPESERGFWIRAGAEGRKADGDSNAPGNTLRGGSLALGVDRMLSANVLAGVAGSYGKSELRVDGSGDRGRTRNAAVGVYARYAEGPWSFKGIAGYAVGDSEMNRQVSFGAVSRVATGSFDSRAATVHGEVSYDIPMTGYGLRPLAGLSWAHARQDAYSESGAGALNLNVAGSKTESLRSTAGFSTLHDSGALRIEPRLVWSHEFGDINTPLQAQLSGAGAAGSFTASGARQKRDSLAAGLTLSGRIGRGAELFVDVQAEGNSREAAYAAYVGIRGQW